METFVPFYVAAGMMMYGLGFLASGPSGGKKMVQAYVVWTTVKPLGVILLLIGILLREGGNQLNGRLRWLGATISGIGKVAVDIGNKLLGRKKRRSR